LNESYRKVLGKGSKEVYGLTSLRTLNLQWKVGEIHILLGQNDKAQSYFKKIKVDTKYYLKYVELLHRHGIQFYEDAIRSFNPPFDTIPPYIWIFILATFYNIDP
jgi:hypothetical protein